MDKIQLMIIGAQKAGTTSLGKYLSEHPLLVEPKCMEFTWFTDHKERTVALDEYMERYYPSGLAEGTRLIAKMANLYCYRSGLELLREHNPQCHLVMIVRDPVQRAYSAYRMACFDGWLKYEPRFFEHLLKAEPADNGMHRIMLGYGYYAQHLRSVFELFPESHVHVLRFEDLKKAPQDVCDRLFELLGLERWSLNDLGRVHNETKMARSQMLTSLILWLRNERNPIKRSIRRLIPYNAYSKLGDRVRDLNRSNKDFPPLDVTTKRLLADHYRAEDATLAFMTGLDLSNWTSQRSLSSEFGVVIPG